MATRPPENLERDLATMRLSPADPAYQKGDPLLEIVRARTDVKDSTYVSKMTGRTAQRIMAAVNMVREELELLVERGLTVQEIREHFGIERSSGKASRRRTAGLPEVATLEEALDMPYDEPFVFSRDDVETPTGRHFKPYQTAYRKRCRDGSDRVVHSSDLHQLLDEDGFVRSHGEVTKERERRRKERQAERRAERAAAERSQVAPTE